VVARVVAPSGGVETVRFVPPSGDGEWGVFSASYTAREQGRHEVTVSCRQTGDRLDTSFFVQGTAAEGIGRPARPEVLSEIAQATRGAVVSSAEITSLVASLAALPEPPPSQRRMQLWCHPVVVSVLIGLLGIFWTARKWLGLV
jgi:hypothetical protein